MSENKGTGETDADRDDTPRHFVSIVTPGFEGHVLDDASVRLVWNAEPGVRGYNVYRQRRYVRTVFTNGYVDAGLADGGYAYEIRSFIDKVENATIATGLSVQVSGSGRADPNAPRTMEADFLDDYELVFGDEFDSGALDPTRWNTSFLWGPGLVINSEEQYYVDTLGRDRDLGYDPFTFEDGKLVVHSIPTPDALKPRARARGTDRSGNAFEREQPYLSGMISSYDAFKFTYGYVEARVRMPYGKGLWTAFWLLNAYYVNDKPEIDIVEYLGHEPNVAYHTYHYYDSNGRLRSTESKPTIGIGLADGFHTFGVDWRPGLIVYYIDGAEVYRVSDAKVSRQDMYIIVNTALGGWWPGSPDASTPFPARYEIDYIRAYQQITPYDPPPQSDSPSGIEPAEEVPGASPAHRPPPELWPEGYPDGR